MLIIEAFACKVTALECIVSIITGELGNKRTSAMRSGEYMAVGTTRAKRVL